MIYKKVAIIFLKNLEEETSCKCAKSVLDCSKKYIRDGRLTDPNVYVLNTTFTFTNVSYNDNSITQLKKVRVILIECFLKCFHISGSISSKICKKYY